MVELKLYSLSCNKHLKHRKNTFCHFSYVCANFRSVYSLNFKSGKMCDISRGHRISALLYTIQNSLCTFCFNLLIVYLVQTSFLVLPLCSFNCVMNRPGLRAELSEKFLEVFGWFEAELETVQKIYESQKVSKIFIGLING